MGKDSRIGKLCFQTEGSVNRRSTTENLAFDRVDRVAEISTIHHLLLRSRSPYFPKGLSASLGNRQ